MEKICTKCNIEKDICEYSRNKSKKDGYEYSCKKCVKEYRKNNKNIQAYRKEYNEKYNNENKDILKEKRKSVDRNLYHKEYRKENGTKRKEYDKQYRLKHKERRKEIKAAYIKEKYVKDPKFKFKENIRKLILHSFRNNDCTKNKKTINILGCSIEEFKTYIERKFEPWMTIYNQGKYTGNYNETWQLDHIIPLSTAKCEDDIIRLNHHTNFQPLCSRKNLEKSNKIL